MQKKLSRIDAAFLFSFSLFTTLLLVQICSASQRISLLSTSATSISAGSDLTAVCATNLKLLGRAVIQYAQDYDEKFPPMQTVQAFQDAVRPYAHNPAIFTCPDTGTAYVPNAALSGQSYAVLGEPDTVEVVADAKPHEDGLKAAFFLDGHIERGGMEYGSPNQIVLERAKRVAVGLEQYFQDYDDTFPPMQTPQVFQTAVYPYVRSRRAFEAPTGQPFVPNAALSNKNLNQYRGQQSILLFKDTSPSIGGTPTKAYLDDLDQQLRVYVSHKPLLHGLGMSAGGLAVIWTIQPDGSHSQHLISNPGWMARALAEGWNGDLRLLWTNSSGRASVWNLSDTHPAAQALLYGPYPGWTAQSLTVDPDNAARLLWTNTDGRVWLWNLKASHPDTTGLIYGPYSGWTAQMQSLGLNGSDRLLWHNDNGRVWLWNLSDPHPAASGFFYNPDPGTTLQAFSVGPDNAPCLLWDQDSASALLWKVFSDGSYNEGSYPNQGYNGIDLAIGYDNSPHILWNDRQGNFALTLLSEQPVFYGPYPDWTAVSISASQ